MNIYLSLKSFNKKSIFSHKNLALIWIDIFLVFFHFQCLIQEYSEYKQIYISHLCMGVCVCVCGHTVCSMPEPTYFSLSPCKHLTLCSYKNLSVILGVWVNTSAAYPCFSEVYIEISSAAFYTQRINLQIQLARWTFLLTSNHKPRNIQFSL